MAVILSDWRWPVSKGPLLLDFTNSAKIDGEATSQNLGSPGLGRRKDHPFRRHFKTVLAAFVAHGSSSIRLVVIEYLALWGSIGAVEGRFLVVAMSMERLEVP